MSFRALIFTSLVFLGLQTQTLHAAWSAPVPLGNSLRATSDPSCAPVGPGEVACAVRDTTHQLAVNTFASGGWSGWTVLNGVITSSPSCVPRASREVICAARDKNSALVFTVFNGTAWSLLNQAGVALLSSPSCARLSATKIMCAARNVNGGFSAATYSGGIWSGFIAAPVASTFVAPGCAGDNNGKAICATLDQQGRVIENRFDGSIWEGSVQTNISADEPSTCASNGIAGQVFCFTRRVDAFGFKQRFLGGIWSLAGWSGWTGLIGPQLSSSISCASTAAGLLTCTAVAATDHMVYFNTFNATSWTAWSLVGDQAIGNTSCAKFNNSKVLCAVVGVNNKVTSRTGP